MWLQKSALALLFLSVTAYAQQQPLPPEPGTTSTMYPPLPTGMRVFVGSSGTYARNTPSHTGQCGTPAHECAAADVVAPNTYGVVQNDPPVLDAGGWSWQRVQFDNAITGWVMSYPPNINTLSPPQMISGVPFQVIADYTGPVLTQAVCINDGANSPATVQLSPFNGAVQGTLLCPWPTAGIGNHKVVIHAVNGSGTMASPEFQFAVTTAPVVASPAQPQNLRIGPASGTPIQRLQDVEKAAKPTPAKK